MLLLQKVFLNELRLSPAMYIKFGSFSISYPDCVPRNPNSNDSGIHVIRNMQFYRDSWDEGVRHRQSNYVCICNVFFYNVYH